MVGEGGGEITLVACDEVEKDDEYNFFLVFLGVDGLFKLSSEGILVTI